MPYLYLVVVFCLKSDTKKCSTEIYQANFVTEQACYETGILSSNMYPKGLEAPKSTDSNIALQNYTTEYDSGQPSDFHPEYDTANGPGTTTNYSNDSVITAPLTDKEYIIQKLVMHR